MKERGYNNGFIQRKAGGKYEGEIEIDGVDLSPIEGIFFKDEKGDTYLWLKRKPMLEYNLETGEYYNKRREPMWEVYLKKQPKGVLSFKGEFVFFRFCYTIVAIIDSVIGKEKQRLNFFVERKPMGEQTIINNINKRKSDERRK